MQRILAYALGIALGVVAIGAVLVVATDTEIDEFTDAIGINLSSENNTHYSKPVNNNPVQSHNKPEPESPPAPTMTPKESEDSDGMSATQVESIYQENRDVFYYHKNNYEQRFGDTTEDWAQIYREDASYYNKMAHILYSKDADKYQEYILQYAAFRDAMEELAALHEQHSTPEAIETMRK